MDGSRFLKTQRECDIFGGDAGATGLKIVGAADASAALAVDLQHFGKIGNRIFL
jgi:hypothetical protein